MKWILVAVALLLILGPLRRRFFSNWRFTVPACLAGTVAWFVLSGVRQPDEPWWLPPAVAVLVALGAGAAGKEWFDHVFGKEK